MSDLIDRQAVLELVNKGYMGLYTRQTDIEIMKDKINDLPSVTPTERTGHWIVGSDTDIKGETVYWFTCSNCNSDRGQHTNYCPDCGAKMKNTCEEVRGDTE